MLTANDIKTRGVKAIDEEMENREEVGISVRGKVKYVIVPVEKYDEFREWELDRAIEESQEDIKSGKFTTSIEEHFTELDKEINA